MDLVFDADDDVRMPCTARVVPLTRRCVLALAVDRHGAMRVRGGGAVRVPGRARGARRGWLRAC
ncbi:MAG: hypothetical protein QM639_18460 [Rhodocyclaceae bacterium]